jgi:HSP20 family protein
MRRGFLLQENRPSVWDLMSEVEKVFQDRWPAGGVTADGAQFNPHVDVREREDYYLISVDLPGINKNQVNVECQDGRLRISGERSREDTKNDEHFHRTERSWGSFERSFQLPSDVEEENIQARFEDGVLEVMIPKTEKSKPRMISIDSERKGLFSKLLGSKSTEDKEKREKKEEHH